MGQGSDAVALCSDSNATVVHVKDLCLAEMHGSRSGAASGYRGFRHDA